MSNKHRTPALVETVEPVGPVEADIEATLLDVPVAETLPEDMPTEPTEADTEPSEEPVETLVLPGFEERPFLPAKGAPTHEGNSAEFKAWRAENPRIIGG